MALGRAVDTVRGLLSPQLCSAIGRLPPENCAYKRLHAAPVPIGLHVIQAPGVQHLLIGAFDHPFEAVAGWAGGDPAPVESMIRKSGNRFSEKIMLNQKDEIMIRFYLIGS